MSSKSKSISTTKTTTFTILGIAVVALLMALSATENYSEGERIGYITKFSHKGRFWKSWEGELNLTQTGMNTSSLFEFSIDNDHESPAVIALIDSAVNNGWKVKLTYHQTYFKNMFKNRGDTDYFIKSVEILDRAPFMHGAPAAGEVSPGRVVDTVYVVIDKNEIRNRK